jgi:hypothetical protein
MDMQILAFQDTASLNSIDFKTGRDGERVLDIRGKYFHDVTDVRINGVSSPEFIVLSQSRLLAEIPDRSAPILDVVVLTGQEGVSKSSIISFEAFVGGKIATGRTALVQRFLKVLLSSPNRDIFRPSGGGLMSLVGASLSQGELQVRANMAVETASQILQRSQQDNPYLEDSEKLRKVEVTSLSFDKAAATLFLGLIVTAVDGTFSYSSLSL